MMKEMTLEEMKETIGGEAKYLIGDHPSQEFEFWDLVVMPSHPEIGKGRVIVPGADKSFVVFEEVNGVIPNWKLQKFGHRTA